MRSPESCSPAKNLKIEKILVNESMSRPRRTSESNVSLNSIFNFKNLPTVTLNGPHTQYLRVMYGTYMNPMTLSVLHSRPLIGMILTVVLRRTHRMPVPLAEHE